MRILIVNGYSQTQNGEHKFLAYLNTIKQVSVYYFLLQKMFLCQKELLDTETEFYVRTAENLEDFLFEGEEFSNIESGIAFDYIDLVFVEIESNLRPWSAFTKKIVTLIRMCLRANKILFASSAAMLVVVFLIATNFENPITIINGTNGGPIGDLSKVKKELRKVKKNEFFLDNVTGDIYGIHISPDEEISWKPIGNAGIHYRKAAEEFKKIGQYMVKAPVYRPKTTLSQALYKSTNEEEICYIRKSHVQDWFLRGLPAEFIIKSAHSWDIHSFNFVNPLKTFITLAETQRSVKGPAIIKLTESIFAVLFCIEKKFECSITVLKNFINYQLTLIRALKVKSTKINLANEQVRLKKMALNTLSLDNNKNINTKKTQAANIKFQVLAKFHHVGYAAKKKSQFEFVINNAIGQNKGQRGQSAQQNSIKKSGSSQAFFKKNHPSQNNNFIESIDSIEKNFYDCDNEEQLQANELERQNLHPFRKTQSEIRQMLHPKIRDEGVPPPQELWVPGNMKAALPQENEYQRPITANSRYTKSKMSLVNTDIQKNSISRPYSSFKHQSSSYEVFLRNGQPYISNDEIERREQMVKQKKKKFKIYQEKDKLIIGPRFIKTKSDGPHFVQNSLYTSPYNPPSEHKFRIENKNKWVDDQDFIAC